MPQDLSAVLREQLPLPGPYVAPRSATERDLAGIWREAFGMDRVGVEDDFNDLGGDSLIATIMFAMIRESFGLAVPMAALAASPTIARLAVRIDDLKRGAA